MGQFLYLLLIYPLYQIIEFCYTLSDGIVKNPGLAIVGVSLAVSFLCLPLFPLSLFPFPSDTVLSNTVISNTMIPEKQYISVIL